MNTQNKLTVCVITYNSVQYLPELLRSIEDSSFKEFELVFIDNNSTDGTDLYLSGNAFPKRVINLALNTGHSHAANVALKECKTRYLVLLDHDTLVDKDLFRNLYIQAEKDKESDFAVFAPRIIDVGRDEVYYGGEFHYIGKTYTYRWEPPEREVGMIGSTAPLLDLEKIPPGTLFDEDFFIYWNDADYFYRIRACGKKIKLVPEAVVTHFGGTKNYSYRGGGRYSHVRAFYVLRNHRLFIIKNYMWSTIFLFLPCFLLYELYNIAFCFRKMVFFRGYLPSVLGTLRLLPRMIKKRRDLAKLRAVKDKRLVGWYKLDYNPGVVTGRAESLFLGFLDGFLRFYYLVVKAVFWR